MADEAKTEATCSTCPWWAERECRRNPPRGGFTRTNPDAWCGEHPGRRQTINATGGGFLWPSGFPMSDEDVKRYGFDTVEVHGSKPSAIRED